MNVPPTEDLPLSKESLCGGCGKPNLTPFHGRTCDHILCGSCWQKSAFNLGEEKNLCVVCKTPTDLLCYRDYDKFIAYNVYHGELRPDTLGAQVRVLKAKDPDAVAKAMDALERHHKEVFQLLLNECMVNRVRNHLKKAWLREHGGRGKKQKREEPSVKSKDIGIFTTALSKT